MVYIVVINDNIIIILTIKYLVFLARDLLVPNTPGSEAGKDTYHGSKILWSV